jgi:sugar transferase (PEP-CTERM system associated)
MLSAEQGYLKILLISLCITACMYYFDLYNSAILSNRFEILVRLLQGLGTASIFLSLLYYTYPRLQLGRGIVAIGFCLVAAALFVCRRLFLAINGRTRFSERVLLVGEGILATSLRGVLESRPELGLQVVGHLRPSLEETVGEERPPIRRGDRWAGVNSEELRQAVELSRVNCVMIAMDDRRGKLPVTELLTLKTRGVRIQDGTDVYEKVTGKVPIESIRLGWLLFSPGFCVSRALTMYKRSASILVSTMGLFLSLPLIPLVAVAIKMTSPGPVFYKQKRVGRDGLVFDCYKFRTMRADAEADTGPTWAEDNDPRITRVGRFLRISRLDEVPQLWNVLRGDMSLVGPRPERPEFVETLAQEIPYYNLRQAVRPGITGWAQIRYQYGSSVEDAKEKLRHDLFYIKNLSPGLDSLILLNTIKTILWGRGAR